jgi:hypothetical protein
MRSLFRDLASYFWSDSERARTCNPLFAIRAETMKPSLNYTGLILIEMTEIINHEKDLLIEDQVVPLLEEKDF